MFIRLYVWNTLISIDQTVNVLLGGLPDETLSSRLGRFYLRNPNVPWYDPRLWLIKILNTIDPNHVFDAIEMDDKGNPIKCKKEDKNAH